MFVPELVQEVHASYCAAGADIIITNTYSANAHLMGGSPSAAVSATETKRLTALTRNSSAWTSPNDRYLRREGKKAAVSRATNRVRQQVVRSIRQPLGQTEPTEHD